MLIFFHCYCLPQFQMYKKISNCKSLKKTKIGVYDIPLYNRQTYKQIKCAFFGSYDFFTVNFYFGQHHQQLYYYLITIFMCIRHLFVVCYIQILSENNILWQTSCKLSPLAEKRGVQVDFYKSNFTKYMT